MANDVNKGGARGNLSTGIRVDMGYAGVGSRPAFGYRPPPAPAPKVAAAPPPMMGTLPEPVGTPLPLPTPGPTTTAPLTPPAPDLPSLQALSGGGKKSDSVDPMLRDRQVMLKDLSQRTPPSLAALLQGKAY